ncbi:bifunctional diaminohydroxyphosphoribosylaminopyrimidine deaminase/5-amino-6-(5-phosphoribosylamino)uracil reductase RibD [Candidatus Woesearchaeota archaeon]|nr:bifunctional diaminohydroxyphosphoribosylaminopyrimidine deaminase/5-amino-6-(5-phosphoribosylamino)uracil reductase RibD [Candidatus Woesearchaeota archaeon]
MYKLDYSLKMNHKFFMQKALEEAKKAVCVPAPRVGAIIVNNNRIIAKGHTKSDAVHAEIDALNKIKNKEILKESTLYVTLEPHNNSKRTPPCTDAILKQGIKKVIIASQDPHLPERGMGIKKLKKAGVEVIQDVLKKQAQDLNKYYFYAKEHNKPYIIQKAAMTLDGKIWSKKQTRISGEKSFHYVHVLRNEVDAILVGINTVLKDDPRLTCRLKDGKDPLRIILDSSLKIPLSAKVLKDNNVLIITTNQANIKKKIILQKQGIDIFNIGKEIDLKKLMPFFCEKRIRSILVEGGSKVHTSFLKSGLSDEFQLDISPFIFGSRNTLSLFDENISFSMKLNSVKRRGDDICLVFKQGKLL